MKRNEVRDYIKTTLRVYRDQGLDEDEAVKKIIDAVTNSWFFSWNNMFIGYVIGAIIALIFLTIKYE